MVCCNCCTRTDVPVAKTNVFKNGRELRNAYGSEGANVNFVEVDGEVLNVRTYERGVEDETLSCGTGVTAVALSLFETKIVNSNKVILKTPGGVLTVRFEHAKGLYRNVYLEGRAALVFKGIWV